jgi:hypothetical protein
MKSITTLLLGCLLSFSIMAQSPVCFSSADGTDGSSWYYKDYVIPAGFKIDSIFMNATRPGYTGSNLALNMWYCPSSGSYTNCSGGKPTLAYANFTTSMYNVWLRVDTANNKAPGMVRVNIPPDAIWAQLCIATSAISSACAIDISTGLVARYDFTGNANDLSGNSLNGTVNGATLTTDRFSNTNSAYHFTNGADKIVVADNNLLSLTGSFGFNFWLNVSGFSGAFNSVLSKYPSGSCWRFRCNSPHLTA